MRGDDGEEEEEVGLLFLRLLVYWELVSFVEVSGAVGVVTQSGMLIVTTAPL